MKTAYLLLCLSIAALAAGCSGPPQIAASEESMTAADALWTALTARRADLVGQVSRDLDTLHTNGKLPEKAFGALSAIVKQSESGDWDGAIKNLKWFISGQRPAQAG